MNKEIFKSDRYFQLHDYYISHGQLLLRARANQDHITNIDIIFFDTFYTQIASNLKGVIISVVENTDIVKYETVKNYLSYRSSCLFELECQNNKYYIAASFFTVYENTLGINETSLGRIGPGREKVIARSRENLASIER